jgi:hypothetical protein
VGINSLLLAPEKLCFTQMVNDSISLGNNIRYGNRQTGKMILSDSHGRKLYLKNNRGIITIKGILPVSSLLPSGSLGFVIENFSYRHPLQTI